MPLMIATVVLWMGQAAIPPELREIEQRYHVTIEVRTQPFTDQSQGYSIHGETMDARDLAEYCKRFVQEWNRYPAELIQLARVQRVVLASHIKLNEQPRTAVPAFDLNAMYYDVTPARSRPHYTRSVIHHEFFHMVDQRMGLLYRDSAWTALNPPTFRYGSGGAAMRTSGAGDLTESIEGTITPYATSGVEEDKAEIFAHLLVDPEFMADKIDADTVVKAKVDLLKRQLSTFCARVGDQFWRSKPKR